MRLNVLWTFSILALLPLVALTASWGKRSDRAMQSISGLRRVVFTSGLGLITIALLSYLGFVFQIARATEGWLGVYWIRVGCWMSLGGVLLSLVGTGQSRVWASVSAVLLLAIWVGFATMTP